MLKPTLARTHATTDRLARLFLVCFACCLLAIPASGQTSATTATLTGTVRDAAGAIVSGATITLHDLVTNQTRQIVSDSGGDYRATALPVGDYEVRAEAKGFATYINPSITLGLGATITLDITLRPSDVSASVTVTDRPPPIDPTQTAVTTSIDPERIEELPVNSRNYLQFTLLAPGVAPSSPQQTGGSGSSSSAPLADSGFTFGGLRARSNTISIDGLDNTDETSRAARVALSPEIVREFQIVNNGLSAEFGGSAGGAINVVTRTGANEFHGDAFLFFQNETLDARATRAGNTGGARPRFHRYQPGFALGGPVKHDRAFFYFAAEQEHLSAEDQSEINVTLRSRVNAALAAGFAPRLAVRSLASNRFPVGRDETEATAKLTSFVGQRHTLNFRFAFTDDRTRADAFDTDALSSSSAQSPTSSPRDPRSGGNRSAIRARASA